jgi:hypothetical protein
MGHESGYQATMDAGGNLDRDEPVGHPGYGRLTQWYEDDRLGGRVLPVPILPPLITTQFKQLYWLFIQ